MVQNETWLNGLKASEYFNIEVAEENTAVACTSNLLMSTRIHQKLLKSQRENHHKIMNKKNE